MTGGRLRTDNGRASGDGGRLGVGLLLLLLELQDGSGSGEPRSGSLVSGHTRPRSALAGLAARRPAKDTPRAPRDGQTKAKRNRQAERQAAWFDKAEKRSLRARA